MKTKHCGDTKPHAKHNYSEPNPDPRKTTQVLYKCPGTPKKKGE